MSEQQLESSTSELDRESLETRVARLEGKLGWRSQNISLDPRYRNWAAGLLVLSILLGLKGMGFPNHYYQVVLAALTIALAYHREWLIVPVRTAEWSLAVLNTISISILYKLVIGGGNRFPLDWLYYPVLKQAGEEQSSWKDVVPNMELHWQATPITEWSIDLTIIQTFLLLVTLIGATVDFQPFISLTAFLLILVSLPALISFGWPWVFPAIIVAVVALYLQSASANEE